ncbi:MAG: replication-associated recombination protein A [Planctomycetota bacterium]|jgi:putative ATPase
MTVQNSNTWAGADDDLFAEQRADLRRAAEPLALRLRPRTIDEVIGQRHILGEGELLPRMLAADRLTSMIFTGPPGTGKTTLAEIIATGTGRRFERGHAAMIGVADLRTILKQARSRLESGGGATVLFLDEIHRFARNQQDVLLDDAERGVVTLIGATTENPAFALNSALLSRATVLRFESISEEDIVALLQRAIADPRGFEALDIDLHDDAARLIATRCDGDARRALVALEVAILSQLQAGVSGATRITVDRLVAEQSMQAKMIVHDRTGDEHYDVVSAFIKSMRGSDPDATVHWLARMLEAGEDPSFIARRITLVASEDVGNADPAAISVALAAWQAAERIGHPECELPLAQAAIYMAAAPKSNAAAAAVWAARRDVKEGRTVAVPQHLRNQKPGQPSDPQQKYQSPHARADGYVEQDYGARQRYYDPTDRGFEKEIRRRLAVLETPSSRPDDERDGTQG